MQIAKRSFGRVAVAVVLSATMIGSGCSTNWIGEAEQIVAALIPAAANLVTLVAALQGKSASAADLQLVQNTGAQAAADLQVIQSLIAAYEKADEASKPGILNRIQNAIGAVQANLQGVLPALHIKDAATQAKITAVVGILLSEVQALAAVVPLVTEAPALAARNMSSMGHAAGPSAALRAVDSPFDSAQGRRGRLSPHVPLSAREFVKAYNATLTARTGNVELDRATKQLEIHCHSQVERWASGGVLK